MSFTGDPRRGGEADRDARPARYDSSARRIDAAFTTFASFDKALREAAISEGFTFLLE
jgi:hypothetical protein